MKVKGSGLNNIKYKKFRHKEHVYCACFNLSERKFVLNFKITSITELVISAVLSRDQPATTETGAYLCKQR